MEMEHNSSGAGRNFMHNRAKNEKKNIYIFFIEFFFNASYGNKWNNLRKIVIY